MQLPIKTPEDWKKIRAMQPVTEEDLLKVDDIEFRARFRERCHHTMEIQIYEAIEKKRPLALDVTDTADLYFKVWDAKGLSHELPDYRFASRLLDMAHTLQRGELPDLTTFEPRWFTDEERQVVDRLIYERRSVRHWDWDRPVPDELLDKAMDAGLWASHACNLQSIRYLIVHEKECPNMFRGGDIPPGPVHIVVCQDMRVYEANKYMPDYNAIMDSGCAGQNILLQLHALGLGACWVTFMSDAMRKRLVDKFNLPEYISICYYIDVGYPTQTPCPPYRIGVDEAVLGRI